MSCLRIATGAPALLLLASHPSLAFEAEADTVLEEIVVTGTLRQQPLQDVAASVTVLDDEVLVAAGQQHFQDVLALVPNLSWAAGSSRPRYFQIRGIGEREQYEGAPNPSVGFLIDDVDFSGLGMPATLFDVAQIEVLRGPQGTRYGANALAGLMVVRGKAPQRDYGYSLEATGAQYGTWSLGAAATGPVDGLDSAWRVSVHNYRSDGFMRNRALGRDDTNGRDELVARAKWRTWVGEEGTLDFTFLHAGIDNGYDAWTLDGSRDTQTNQPGTDHQRTNAASLRLDNAPVGSNALTAVASYASTKTLYGYDYDWGSTAFWDPYFYEGDEYWDRERRTGSVELRLGSHLAGEPGSVAWLAGAYALRLEEDGRYVSGGEYIDPVDPGFSWTDERLLDDRYHATSLALFGQLDGNLTREWSWSAGLRAERRRARYRDSGEANGEVQSSDLRARDRMVGGQVSVSRQFGNDRTAYALVSRGYKAGGFNLGAVPDELRDFDPEFLWNLETGLKAQLAGGRGHASAAVFYQRRRDQQVRSGRQLVGGGPYEFVTTNLPAGYSTGVELSLDHEVRRHWRLGASLGLLRSRSGETVNEDGDPVPSRESAHSPEYTAAVNATWRHPAGFFARVDVTATDDFYFDVPTDHDQRSAAYMLTNLKVGLDRGQWRIHAWLRNAFDKKYAVRGFYFGNDPRMGWADGLYRQWGDPRQLGVTVAVDFGSGGV